jgi:hypothetical protein
MTRYIILLIFLAGVNAGINAQESTGISSEGRQLINKTTQDYNICVQQNALQQLDNYSDIRVVAAHAVEHCEHQLNAFKENFAAKRNPEFYSGLERSIKNRAIRNLLPLLMYEKSSRQTAETEK